MPHAIGAFIAQKRKALGYTQQKLADQLNISFQAVSKWENGASLPDVWMLPRLAACLHTTVDALLGHQPGPQTAYEEKYRQEGYYWGFEPNRMCYDIMRLRPPVRPLRVLDIGCGEGKDAVFLARNGYIVTAFDLAGEGLRKARQLAERNRAQVRFFQADVRDYQPSEPFDIIFSSGVFHYIPPEERIDVIRRLKDCTAPHGLNAINVFVSKPFIPPAPDLEPAERQTPPWRSGELFGYYHDWRFHLHEESIFDCHSSGVPHQHCMVRMIAEKPDLS